MSDWDARWTERSALFAPLRSLAESFVSFADWPTVADWDRAFAFGPWARAAGVRFVSSMPRPRRRRAPAAGCDPASLYDARIVRGEVPSRERSWHDFANLHVWAAFPRAKRALHERQHAMMSERIDPEHPSVPPHRTPEQDAIAMVDEGGAVLLVPTAISSDFERSLAERRWDAIAQHVAHDHVGLLVFGHGIYEVLRAETRPIEAMALVRRVDVMPASMADRLALADAWLAERLGSRDHFRAHGEHPTLRLPGLPSVER